MPNSNAGPSSLPPTVASVLYVRQGGSDTAGDGTLSKPLATIQQALTNITDNTASKVYEINVGPGIFPTPFQIKPFVAIVGTDSGSNFFGQTQITAGANTCGFDPSWGTSGFAYAWMAALVFTNGQTYNEVVGSQPQLNYRSCTFQGLMVYTGPGTTGTDNLLWEGCIAYGGVTVEGWQFFWTRHTEMLGGTVTIQSAANAGATETTEWLSQDSAVGRISNPTAVIIRWAAPTPVGLLAVGEMNNSTIVGSLTLDGPHTSFFGTSEAIPQQAISFINGALATNVTFNYAPTNVVVLRPGGVAGGNVFTSWTSLYAAASVVPGGARVLFDDSLGAITIPAGAYNIDGWQWANGSGAATVTIADGASATWRNLWIDAVTVVGNNTAPFFNATINANLYIKDGAIVQSTSTGVFVESSTATGFVFITASEAYTIGDGAHVTFTATGAGATMELFLSSGGSLAAGAYTATGGASASLNWEASVSVPALTTLTGITFDYDELPNGGALEQIVNAAAATIVATAGIGVQRRKSGQVQLDCTFTVVPSSAAATLTGQFTRDGAPIGPTVVGEAPAGGDPVPLPLNWIDPLPDNATHTYNFQATASAGTITSTAGQGSLRVLEL